jgi:hypothetical protein
MLYTRAHYRSGWVQVDCATSSGLTPQQIRDYNKLLKEIAHILRPGGLLIRMISVSTFAKTEPSIPSDGAAP